MKHCTPLWLEHVPERFCEQLSVPSLQRAVAVPQEAVAGAHGLGAGGGGLFVFVSDTFTLKLAERVTVCCRGRPSWRRRSPPRILAN